MRKKPARKNSSTLRVAFIFIFFVLLAIFVSIIVKGYLIISKSRFDGQHQIVLEVKSDKSKDFVIFNPDTNSISDLKVYGFISQPILIPDAIIKNIPYTSPKSLMQKLLFNSGNYQTNLTILDVFRLFVFSFSVDKSNVIEKSITLPKDENILPQIFPQKFSDTAIYKEAVPVAVVNDTGVSGVGTQLSQILTNMGVNVVVVSTGSISQHSQITYVQNQTYTSERLSKLLGVDIHKTETITNDSDVTIYLGEDKLYLLKN